MIKRLKKAFTITELVIVIAVIAILAAVLIPTFSNVIENAKESAALQTSKNALTEYLTVASTDDNTTNDDPVGIVFVSDGYAHVYLNGALQYIGELEDFAVMNSSGQMNNVKKLADNGTSGAILQNGAEKVVEGTTYASATITVDPTAAESSDVVVTISATVLNGTTIPAAGVNDGDVAAPVPGDDETVAAAKTPENLYFYEIEINNTHYAGYFTYETEDEPAFTVEGAIYSRQFGYVSGTYGTMVITATAAGAGA